MGINTDMKTALKKLIHYAKVVWEVPAVQSAALTWLIRLGMSASGAAIAIPVLNALVQ